MHGDGDELHQQVQGARGAVLDVLHQGRRHAAEADQDDEVSLPRLHPADEDPLRGLLILPIAVVTTVTFPPPRPSTSTAPCACL